MACRLDGHAFWRTQGSSLLMARFEYNRCNYHRTVHEKRLHVTVQLDEHDRHGRLQDKLLQGRWRVDESQNLEL